MGSGADEVVTRLIDKYNLYYFAFIIYRDLYRAVYIWRSEIDNF